jgi:GxxExxY protein
VVENSAAITENEIARAAIDAAFHVHTKLGPGIFETVYEVTLSHQLRKQGLKVERQVPVPIIWDDIKFDEGFRADLIIEDKFLVELKSIEALAPVHSKQVLTYLRLTDIKLGLLINFGEALLKHGIKRIVNGLDEEPAGL